MDFFKENETIRVYVPLITGLVVFLLTSIYNHWKDRKAFIRQHDTFIDRKVIKRIFAAPFSEKLSSGKHSLFKTSNYQELYDISRDNSLFRAKFFTFINIGDSQVYEVKIKLRVAYKEEGKVSYHIYSGNMDKKEVFYIPFGNANEPINANYLYSLVSYKTSAGSKYVILNYRVGSKIRALTIKFKVYFSFFWVPIEFNSLHEKYRTRRKRLT